MLFVFEKKKLKFIYLLILKTKTMFIKSLMLVCLVFFVGNTINAQKYIGAAKCKMCHNSPTKGAQYKQWSESKHANAWNVLSDAEKKDPKCAKCHSTAASVDAGLIATITKEEGVSCESCHGPGSDYKPSSIMKDKEAAKSKGLIEPTEAVCKKCHNSESPHFKGFDYAAAKAKIAHPKP